MATATAVRRNDVVGNLRLTVTDFALDSSYPTGGEALTAAQLGLLTVKFAFATVKVSDADAVYAVYDVANAKLLAYTASAEVANAVDLAALVVTVVAFGE